MKPKILVKKLWIRIIHEFCKEDAEHQSFYLAGAFLLEKMLEKILECLNHLDVILLLYRGAPKKEQKENAAEA